MKLRRTALAALFTILLAAPALANTTSFWTQAGVPQFYKGKFSKGKICDHKRSNKNIR